MNGMRGLPAAGTSTANWPALSVRTTSERQVPAATDICARLSGVSESAASTRPLMAGTLVCARASGLRQTHKTAMIATFCNACIVAAVGLDAGVITTVDPQGDVPRLQAFVR